MDSIRKDYLDMITSSEMLEASQLLTKVERQGLIVEVMFAALKEMKEKPNLSIISCLEVASEGWDI
tara:strand:+ start:298 stop:495 length:198 start_codon:yes stop_codon:yes gene_type:complete